jgi:hypothetical protein
MTPEESDIAVASVEIPDSLPRLGKGHHARGSMTPCAMEAASWLAGDRWSDHPRSVHPVIARVARWVNDTVPDEQRQGHWPLILASIGTRRRGRVVLWWRLAYFAQRSLRRYPPNGERWEAVLVRFGELTGRDPRLLSPQRQGALETSLLRPFVATSDDGATNPDDVVLRSREEPEPMS